MLRYFIEKGVVYSEAGNSGEMELALRYSGMMLIMSEVYFKTEITALLMNSRKEIRNYINKK